MQVQINSTNSQAISKALPKMSSMNGTTRKVPSKDDFVNTAVERYLAELKKNKIRFLTALEAMDIRNLRRWIRHTQDAHMH